MTNTLIFAVVFATLTFAVVAWPLLRGKSSAAPLPEQDEALAELRRKRDQIYEALRDLEFDERTGKISADDYAEMSDRYKRRAITMLKQLDDQQRDALLALESEVEEQVLAARTVRHSPDRAPVRVRCVACGADLESGDRFCRRCGVVVAKSCRRCRAALPGGATSCTRCGTTV